MRTVTTVLLWMIATVCTVGAIGASWTATHVQSEDGFVRLLSHLGEDPEVQQTAADLAGESFADQPSVPSVVHDAVATSMSRAIIRLTQAEGWSVAWSETIRRTHQNLYSSDPTPASVTVDVAPITAVALEQMTEALPISPASPESLWVTVSEQDPTDMVTATSRARGTALVSGGLAVIAAVLMLFTARRRSTAVAAIGFGALLAAGFWWFAGRQALPRVIEQGTESTPRVQALQDILTDRIVTSFDTTLSWVAAAGAVCVVVGLVSRASRS